MEELLIHYGLFAVALFAFFEGDVTYIMAGIVAHMGLIDFWAVIVIGSVCSFANDAIWYWVGHHQSHRVKTNRAYLQAGPTVERLAAKYGAWQIMTTRLVYGTRIASAIFWGVQKYSFARYSVLAFTGCLLWATLLTSLGYFLSTSAELLMSEIKTLELWLLGGLLAAIGVYIIRRAWFRQRAKSELAEE